MARRTVFAAALVVAVVVTACGSDVSSVPDQSSVTTGAPGTVTVPTSVGNIPGVSSECEALLNLYLSITAAFTGGSVQSLDAATLAGLPADVRADAQLISDTLQQFSEGLQALGIDLSNPASLATLTEAQQQAFSDLSDSMDTDAFQAASDRLSAYGDQQCASEFGGTP